MNPKDLPTQSFQATTRIPYRVSQRRRKKSHPLLLAALSIFVLILLIAIILIIKDIATDGKDSETEPEVSSVPVETGENPVDHPIDLAYDGNDNTYMLSSSNQATGAWLQLNLGISTTLSSVGIISNHEQYYIRSADVQISGDGETWIDIGEFTGTPSNNAEIICTLTGTYTAKYVRILLTGNASVLWAVNTVNIKDITGAALSVASASIGSIGKGSGFATDTQATEKENTVLKSYAEIRTGNLILVSTKHLYSFPETTVNILRMYDNRTQVDGNNVFQIGETELCLLDATALKHLNSMCEDYCKTYRSWNLHVGTNGGYRSRETQDSLYSKYPTTAAQAGASEHNTGLCVDLDIFSNGLVYSFNDTTNTECAQAFAWLTANAYKYGFVRRYPETKDSVTGMAMDRYHWRYVGYPHSYYMMQQNYCLEEYLTDLETHYNYNGDHLHITGEDGNRYEIYFVKASSPGTDTEVPVPVGYSYTISGNNYSGFIVTVTK